MRLKFLDLGNFEVFGVRQAWLAGPDCERDNGERKPNYDSIVHF